jgi:casein kinase 1
MIRVNNHPSVFLIDFGLARPFRNPATYLHIPYSKDHLPIGTVPFMSVNTQQGYSQSRRDDLESLAYTIIHSTRGNLPWRNISANRILKKKESITPEELCEGLPVHFCKFVSYVRSLGFDEKPDYQSLHSILSKCAAAETDVVGKALPSLACSSVDGNRTEVLQ